MGLFEPKLVPGERLVWRYPLAFNSRQWAFRLAIALGVGGIVFAIYHLVGREGGAGFWPYWQAFIWFLAALAVGANGHPWQVAVTDRRLLFRRMAPWRAPREIPLDEIESVAKDVAAHRVLVRGGGQEIWINADLVELTDLKRVLGLADGPA